MTPTWSHSLLNRFSKPARVAPTWSHVLVVRSIWSHVESPDPGWKGGPHAVCADMDARREGPARSCGQGLSSERREAMYGQRGRDRPRCRSLPQRTHPAAPALAHPRALRQEEPSTAATASLPTNTRSPRIFTTGDPHNAKRPCMYRQAGLFFLSDATCLWRSSRAR